MENKIKALKEKLQYVGTRELLGMISIHFITFASDGKEFASNSDIFNKTRLLSPQKQYLYLAGLLMSTEDKSDGKVQSEENPRIYDEIEEAVQEITGEYIKNFISIDPDTDLEVAQHNLVSMDAFISYFDTGILRYPEQTISLIRSLYAGFDKELQSLTCLEMEDFLAFYQLICDEFEASLESSKLVADKLKQAMNSFNPFAVDVDKAFDHFIESTEETVGIELQRAMDGLNTVKVSAVIKFFGEQKGKRLLDIFGLIRQERNFSYYNKSNPFTEHPLCWLDDGETLFIVHPLFVLNAIYDYITDVLENPKNAFAEKYKTEKADIVESLFLNCFKSIYGEEAKYHVSVCEERGTKEHDILVEYNDYILIAEVKASKVREPFFNPERAFPRIRDHFNSDLGIGGAYKQAITLAGFFEEKEDVVLYENHNKKFIISDIDKKKCIPIVLTLNQFGGLSINTSLILEKEEKDPYPWVCNIHDFENIIEILKYLKKTEKDFTDYIVWRSKNHPKIMASDELDIIEGYFLNEQVKKKVAQGTIFFPPNGPSLIDKIYFNNHGVPYDYPAIEPVAHKKKVKVGRNDPCPCGSGKKYKKCCLGNGLYD